MLKKPLFVDHPDKDKSIIVLQVFPYWCHTLISIMFTLFANSFFYR